MMSQSPTTLTPFAENQIVFLLKFVGPNKICPRIVFQIIPTKLARKKVVSLQCLTLPYKINDVFVDLHDETQDI